MLTSAVLNVRRALIISLGDAMGSTTRNLSETCRPPARQSPAARKREGRKA